MRARGKAWPTGEPEPAAWLIEKTDPIGNRAGRARACSSTPSSARISTTLTIVRRINSDLNVHSCATASMASHHDVTDRCPFDRCARDWSLLLLVGVGAGALAASDPGTGDWPMWGGTPDRNMVSNMKGLPDRVGRQDQEEHQVGRRRSARRATATRSSPAAWCSSAPTTKLLRDPKQPGDRGVLMAFRESDGEFLWQQTHAEARVGPRQRLAVPGRRLVAARRRRHSSTTSATAACSGASTSRASATARTTARSRTRS